jgi:chromosomal replication initiation ATPase DnaA
LKRRRGRERERENEARAMAIYLCRAVGGHKLADIGKVMGLKNYSSVSSAYLAVKKRLELEKGLALSARKIEKLLRIRQPS